MNTRRVHPLGAVATLSLLVACSEPHQAAGPESVAPATEEQREKADAEFAAAEAPAPVELSHAKRQLATTPSQDCNLERANGSVFTGEAIDVRGGQLRLSGWVADRELGSIPGEAELRLISATDNRAWEAKVSPALPRADVQKLLGGNVAYANPGYSVTLDVSGLPSGRYRLYTVFPSSDELRACDNGRVISITN